MDFAETKRVTLAGSFTAVTFDHPATAYLVKNYSSADCYVSYVSTATTGTSVKIAKDYGQTCPVYTYNDIRKQFVPSSTSTIYISGTGEVEVTQVC